MNWLFRLCRPFLGEWLRPAGSILSYVNAAAQIYYFFLNFWCCKTSNLEQILGTIFWVPVLVLVVLSGVFYKNFHQFVGFFISFLFLTANVAVLMSRL